HKDGSVHVSANAYVPDHRIDAFVIENIPFIERARFKLEALTAQRIEALQYVTGETVSILGMPVTLEVVETSGKPHIKFDGSSRMVLFVKSAYTYEDKHKLMQTFWRQLGEKVFTIGRGRVSTLYQQHIDVHANGKATAHEESLGVLYTIKAAH
ncbi:MAG: YgjP-like metallopeptidase domain-containing protein, partial [Veillonella sp.]